MTKKENKLVKARLKLITLCVLALTAALPAQWAALYPPTGMPSALPAPDGGYLISGVGPLFKIAASGQIQWGRSYTGYQNQTWLTQDGGCLIALDPEFGDMVMVFRLAPTGGLQWQKKYTVPGEDIDYSVPLTQDYFRSATHADVIGIADLPGYQDFKETDGSGIINFKALRQFRIRAGNWNDNEELQYKYDIAWEKNDKGIPLTKEEQAIYNAGNPQVKSAYTPLKPIVSGSKLDKNGLPNSYNSIVLDKFALYPLSYRIMKEVNSDSNAVKLLTRCREKTLIMWCLQVVERWELRSLIKNTSMESLMTILMM